MNDVRRTEPDLTMGSIELIHRLKPNHHIGRTNSGNHFRVMPGFAEIIGVESVELPGDHGTIPPTELVPTGVFYNGIDRLRNKCSRCNITPERYIMVAEMRAVRDEQLRNRS